ncbi:MAG: DNA-directed RNA polymerase subunit omega [Ilumatobacteraceae bacterium]|jgi:DNA-directed RNA polymerase subunit omega|nr:DNA-directed RNA polymerase subunit omega [Ilumatobacteraceae bacterium]MBJ7507779.1 DNA-directed RNA polymerase subunit omega [Ilumatobacteraceae bacterium]MCX6532650.1 DNA-directed RNA polymerase subunit omega [Actinomycetota bacterium]MSO39113.1 DNA-directed RNA polymerase subunit omega [Ilumatobacteraceae bacterium]
MPANNDSMMTPQLEDLLSKVDSKFSLVTLAASRARELQDYYAKMGSVSSKVVPPQVASLRKPLSMGFEEIAADKIVRVPAEEMAERAAAEQAAIADAAALRAAEAAAILGTAQAVTEVGVDDADSGDA